MQSPTLLSICTTWVEEMVCAARDVQAIVFAKCLVEQESVAEYTSHQGNLCNIAAIWVQIRNAIFSEMYYVSL